jgi:hypothetical protein
VHGTAGPGSLFFEFIIYRHLVALLGWRISLLQDVYVHRTTGTQTADISMPKWNFKA